MEDAMFRDNEDELLAISLSDIDVCLDGARKHLNAKEFKRAEELLRMARREMDDALRMVARKAARQ
jgi:hypothetical protein